ncbi:MAG: hypothetical protein HQ518_19210 [Rhodopirellula sp.]|nr:hypothetical protein [Rhodopirellula sp.]
MPRFNFSHLVVVVTLWCSCVVSPNGSARADELFPKELTNFAPVASNPVSPLRAPGTGM